MTNNEGPAFRGKKPPALLTSRGEAAVKNTTLKTAVQVATARAAVAAKAAAKAAAAAEWARRFDPEAYRCERQGKVWFAFGPLESIFQFRADENGNVLCVSSSGSEYVLTMQDDGERECSCPDRASRPDRPACKHLTAFKAIKRAARVLRTAKAVQSQPEPARVAA